MFPLSSIPLVTLTATLLPFWSIAGSHVAPDSDEVYLLQDEHNIYNTEYSENLPRCSGRKIDNPYSLCNNLPDICDQSTREAGTSLLPTILSTWSVSYTMQSGSKRMKWIAPNPSTNLLIIAKLKLRIPSSQTKTLDQKPGKRTSGCCKGNRYRPSWNVRECIECPELSKSKLRGYYCEFELPPT